MFEGESKGGSFAGVDARDPLADRWRDLPPMATARHGHGATAIAGRVHVISGDPTPGGCYSGRSEIDSR